jgi:hypothetical protein
VGLATVAPLSLQGSLGPSTVSFVIAEGTYAVCGLTIFEITEIRGTSRLPVR